uniref:Uncharacterized protein n=1 Tax=Trichuris muris TaxID=70415 RepID=A0A5S6QD75_TRIMR
MLGSCRSASPPANQRRRRRHPTPPEKSNWLAAFVSAGASSSRSEASPAVRTEMSRRIRPSAASRPALPPPAQGIPPSGGEKKWGRVSWRRKALRRRRGRTPPRVA